MPITKDATLTTVVEVTETKPAQYTVAQFTVRCNGPDAGEIFGHTQIKPADADDATARLHDWVCPKEQVLALATQPLRKLYPDVFAGLKSDVSLYALLYKFIYEQPQVTTEGR